jgi:GT2 family glycosyltransferase
MTDLVAAPRTTPTADAGGTEVVSASVVVCAYTLDRWDLLAAAVRGAMAQRPAPCELVLVVDHNPELATRAARELAGHGVVVVENHHGRGLSGARNTGVETARGELVAFLDDDAEPADGWLAALLGPFDDPEVLATGGTAQPSWTGGRPGWFPPEFDWVVGCSYRGQPEGLAEVRNPLGCNMAFRRRVFAEVEGFREGVGRIGRRPLGCEETELCIRLRQRWPGSRILLVPDAVVDHHVPTDRRGFAYFRQRCFAEGISKAAVTDRVGTDDGLSSERSYLTRTLPRGVAASLWMALRGTARSDGLRRAAAIVAGCAITMLGYTRGRLGPSGGA